MLFDNFFSRVHFAERTYHKYILQYEYNAKKNDLYICFGENSSILFHSKKSSFCKAQFMIYNRHHFSFRLTLWIAIYFNIQRPFVMGRGCSVRIAFLYKYSMAFRRSSIFFLSGEIKRFQRI